MQNFKKKIRDYYAPFYKDGDEITVEEESII